MPDAEILHNRILDSTAVANLRGGEELVDEDEFFPIPRGLVRKLPLHFTPRGIHDGFRQLVVLDHILHGEVLHTDNVVVSNEPRRHLMDGVIPLVGDFLMDACDPEFCLFPVVAPLCFSGELPLEASQFLLVLGIGTRVVKLIFIGSDGEVLESEVDTDHGTRCRERLQNYVLAVDGHEVFATLGLLHCSRENISFDLLADAAIHVPDFREADAPSYDGDSAVVVDRFEAGDVPFLGFETWIPNPTPSLQAAEEIFVGGIEASERRLQGGSIHLSEPMKFLLESGKLSTTFLVGNTFSGLFIGGLPSV